MKTNMNNKLLKVTLLVAILATTQVPALLAQESSTSVGSEVSFVYGSGAEMEIGDSVMIHQDSLRYLTGERMSKWVYGVPHQIRQLGTKTKPTGVLLRGIYSWIAQGSLIPLNVHKTQEYIDAQHAAAIAAAEAEAAARAAAEAEAAAAEAEAARLLAELEEDTVVEVKDTVVPDLPFEINRFSVGVRGGLASMMPQSSVQPSMSSAWGFGVALDLQYAHYWAKGSEKIRLGLLTGLSLGYVQNQKTLNKVTEQSTHFSEGEILYNVSMNSVSTTNTQLQLEVPLMFSMITPKGFSLNVGPKFILPVYTPYTQTISNAHVSATLVDMSTESTKVEVKDNLVTGVLNPENPTNYDLTHEGMNNNQLLNGLTIALGAELGYEYAFASGHSLTIGVYANYGVYNNYKHVAAFDAPTDHHILGIVAPSAAGVAVVTPTSMNNAYVDKLGYLDAGVKLAFHLNWKK